MLLTGWNNGNGMGGGGGGGWGGNMMSGGGGGQRDDLALPQVTIVGKRIYWIKN